MIDFLGASNCSGSSLLRLSDLSWVQRGDPIVGLQQGDQFGASLSLSNDGRTIAIGAPFGAGLVEGSGHVQVYRILEGLAN